jgi:internalin A
VSSIRLRRLEIAMKYFSAATRLAILAAAFVLLACVPDVFSEPSSDRTDVPQLAPPTIEKRWRDAGAEVGWMNPDSPDFVPEPQTARPAGAIPAFRLSCKEGVLARLPDPGTAFGLDLFISNVTDAGLKELAGLKNLRALNLGHTKVTGAGLQALTGLKDLQALDLQFTQASDAGLKGLAGLRSLLPRCKIQPPRSTK